MKILYIYRNRNKGFSIGKVFHPIEDEMKKYANVESFYLPSAKAMPWHLFKNINAVLGKLKAKHYDIIHITGDAYYLVPFLSKRNNVIVTVHDLGFYTNHKKSMHSLYLYLLWIYTLKWANAVTCISKKTETELLSLIDVASLHTVVINNPIGNEFKFVAKSINRICPIVLHVGTKPNKNLENTILALKGIKCRLRIIGNVSVSQKSQMKDLGIDFSCVTGITDEQVAKEYEEADIVNFPSLYEGFGMPIIEGQATGRPVLTSNIAPMNEIAGNAAVLVNPTNYKDIQRGYKELLANPEKYIQAGLDNVKRFSVEKITKEYLKVYFLVSKKQV